MGWGICFGIDDNYRIYCADGCKWRAKESDYEGFSKCPSAREYVLEYYEGDAHRELDMIRDEFPGTAAGLAEACPDHLGSAFSEYERLPDETKLKMHEEKLAVFEEELKSVKEAIPYAMEVYRDAKKAFKEYKPPTKPAKTRVDEILNLMRPLQLELDMEHAATRVDQLKKEKTRVTRFVRMEKTFGTY
jgi:hypothetical protein